MWFITISVRMLQQKKTSKIAVVIESPARSPSILLYRTRSEVDKKPIHVPRGD